ncbi:hypothetical protein ACH5RR_002835 [Cinchona calisaya]|uniref:Cytochrome P450 n=1 Tax=Cinchona calisaya TaxID=153742 RepID=A0ABD3AT40_9GENT
MSIRFVPQLANEIAHDKTSSIVLAKECNQRWRSLRGFAHTELFSAQALEWLSQMRLDKAKKMLDFLSLKNGQLVKIADVLFATNANILANAIVSQDNIEDLGNIEDLKMSTSRIIEFGFPGLVDMYRELFASSETLTTTLEWAMAELITNKEAFSKLRDELTQATKGTKTTLLTDGIDLTSLPYLQACIKETLRLHPPTPFLLPRCALKTCHVMNFRIPKDSLVLVNAYATGRDPKTWEDSLNFKPERFLWWRRGSVES